MAHRQFIKNYNNSLIKIPGQEKLLSLRFFYFKGVQSVLLIFNE